MQKRVQNKSFSLYNFSSKNRRGLSTVIVTLILILVSLVAVGVIWVVVRNVIQTGTEEVGLSQFSLNAKIMNVLVDNNSNNISLTVKRNAGEGELIGISFVFSNSNADTEVITRNVSLKELEQMKFYFHLNTSVSDLISVSIVPLIKQDEKQISGIALDKYNFGSSKNNIPSQTCTPTNCSTLGYVCGTWSDGCSGTLSCGIYGNGSCQTGYNCIGGSCVLNITTYSQDFELVLFPPAGWVSGGNNVWHRNTTEPAFGTASAGSRYINDSQMTYISYNYTFIRNGNVSFWWNVSSEANYDFICFCVDKTCGGTGCTCIGTSGTADARICSSPSSGVWTAGSVTYPVNSSNHTFTWCYAKDGNTIGGSDMGKIDNIVFNF
jgi:hypothetical protein